MLSVLRQKSRTQPPMKTQTWKNCYSFAVTTIFLKRNLAKTAVGCRTSQEKLPRKSQGEGRVWKQNRVNRAHDICFKNLIPLQWAEGGVLFTRCPVPSLGTYQTEM